MLYRSFGFAWDAGRHVGPFFILGLKSDLLDADILRWNLHLQTRQPLVVAESYDSSKGIEPFEFEPYRISSLEILAFAWSYFRIANPSGRWRYYLLSLEKNLLTEFNLKENKNLSFQFAVK